MIVHTGLSLKFLNIIKRGIISEERVHLEAVMDCNSSHYILMATEAIDSQRVAAGSRPTFWFESLNVSAGDNLVVYTKPGTYSRTSRLDGHLNHFFYWGLLLPLFANPSARVVVAELNFWEAAG
jgi:hypothetical protein